jgi:SLT domain-containing protein
MATFYEIYQNYLQNPYGGVNALPGADSAGDGGDGYATGGRIGYAEGGTTTYLTPTEFFETSGTRKEWAKILDELDEIVYSGQYANPEKAEYIKNLEDKKNKLYAQSWDEYYKLSRCCFKTTNNTNRRL